MPTPFRQLESVTSYTADGATTAWNFSFSSGYIDKAHVKAYQLSPLGARTEIPVTLGMFAGPNQLTIIPAILAGYELTIYRDTPTAAPLVDFTDTAAFTEIALDTVVKQATFAAAETQDALSVASARIDQIGSFAQGAQDAQTAALASKNAAAASATAAATSEANAAGSATAAAASAAGVVSSNIMHLTGNESAAGNKTFSGTTTLSGPTVISGALSGAGVTKAAVGLGNVDNTADASKPTSTAQAASIASAVAALLADKNKIINGGFLVNQRAVSGAVTLAAGAYGHDRWKAGAAGCTYTFATVNNVTTITISAGSLQQVIEGINLTSGTHTLSWAGTAQGKIGAGAYSASGVTGAATGGTNLTVEFNTGTLSNVQFEPGATATAYASRLFGVELYFCMRYYQEIGTPGGNDLVFGGYIGTAGTCYQTIAYPVRMRAAPTAGNGGTAFTLVGLTTATFGVVGTTCLRLDLANSSASGGVFYLWQNSAGTCRLTLSAEL